MDTDNASMGTDNASMDTDNASMDADNANMDADNASMDTDNASMGTHRATGAFWPSGWSSRHFSVLKSRAHRSFSFDSASFFGLSRQSVGTAQ